jgi:Ca2+/H+ antiporter
MSRLLDELRHNPLLWLLVFVPVLFASQKLTPESHTVLFVLSILAIVPLARLLSHATESVRRRLDASAIEKSPLLRAALRTRTKKR